MLTLEVFDGERWRKVEALSPENVSHHEEVYVTKMQSKYVEYLSLCEPGQWVRYEELCQLHDRKVSREAVNKIVAALRRKGFRIQGRSGRNGGYRLNWI